MQVGFEKVCRWLGGRLGSDAFYSISINFAHLRTCPWQNVCPEYRIYVLNGKIYCTFPVDLLPVCDNPELQFVRIICGRLFLIGAPCTFQFPNGTTRHQVFDIPPLKSRLSTNRVCCAIVSQGFDQVGPPDRLRGSLKVQNGIKCRACENR